MAKVADDTKLLRILKLEADFRELQKYFVVLSNRAISKNADKHLKKKKKKQLISTKQCIFRTNKDVQDDRT